MLIKKQNGVTDLFSTQASRYPGIAELVRLVLANPVLRVGWLRQAQTIIDVDKVRMGNIVNLTETLAVLAHVPPEVGSESWTLVPARQAWPVLVQFLHR
jgi:hypothetical protein